MIRIEKKKVVFFIFFLTMILVFIANGYFCHSYTRSYCFFGGYASEVLEPILIVSVASFFVAFLTIFISTETFKKWLIYFFIWLFVDVLWVLSADTKSDYFGLTPTKETASIYMGFILVYTSFIWFALSKVQWHLWIKWFVGVISFIIAVVLTFVLT